VTRPGAAANIVSVSNALLVPGPRGGPPLGPTVFKLDISGPNQTALGLVCGWGLVQLRFNGLVCCGHSHNATRRIVPGAR
jgi:hypothetical protein